MSEANNKEWPRNSLPSWDECNLRVKNSQYVEDRIKSGGGGYDKDGKYANQLHKFIYEYDDSDPYRSAWFLHRLELLINEVRTSSDLYEALEECASRLRFLSQHLVGRMGDGALQDMEDLADNASEALSKARG